jgi:site-specific DNA recombinase
MNNAIIYARVSSKDQENEGFSIPAQIKALQEYASKNTLMIYQEFTDVETAKKAGRTQFNKMLKYLEENKHIQHILVEKTDRLLRNISDYALLDRLTTYSDIKIHLIKENTILSRDSRSNEKFIFGIKALMAKNYIDNLSEEVRKGMVEKATQGIYPSTAPYGYVNLRENGKSIIKVDPQAAPFVQKMFELYSTGAYSLLSLRKKMLADGMIYRNGKNFYTSKVETILKNEFYTGIFIWKSKRYENASHEPIISKELFQRVQNVLINPHKSKSRKELFPYTNLITCGLCGCKFTAEIKKSKYIYYHCTGSKGKCKQDYLRQEAIDEQFELLMSKIYISDEVQEIILQGLRESFKDKIEYHNNLVSNLEKQIRLLQNRIDQIYLDKLDRKISEEFWQTNSHAWSTEKEQLLARLLAIQKADSHYLENTRFILELAKNAAGMFKQGNVAKKRMVIDLLTSNCSYKDGNIDLELKPVFGMIMETAKNRNWCALSDYFSNFLYENINFFALKQLLYA